MPRTVTCPHCSRSLSVPEESVGRELSCPLCGGLLLVPLAAMEPAHVVELALAFQAAGEEPTARRGEPYGLEVSDGRIAQLLPEWKAVWAGLRIARWAVLVFVPAYAIRVAATTVGPRFLSSLADALPVLALVLAA